MKKTAWRIIQIFLLALTIAGIVKAVFVSLDIDESYALSEAYRLISGDKLLYDMWEPHQFAAFLPAFFLFLFTKVTKSITFSVIFLRIAGIVIHFGVGAFLYRTASMKCGKNTAFLLFVFHMNFLPKWVAMPEFELMHYWCLLLIFLCFYNFEEKKEWFYPFFAGVFYAVSGLSYPTMVVLFPFFFIVLLVRKNTRKAAFHFTLGAALPVGILLFYIFSYISPKELPKYVGYVFMDASHTEYTAMEKLREYLKQLLGHGIKFGKSLVVALPVTIIASFIYRAKKKKNLSFVEGMVTTLLLSSAFLALRAVFGFLFEDKNQFFFQVRFAVCVLAFLVLGFANIRKGWVELFFGILPAVLSLAAILAITNMDLNTAYAKLMPGIIAGFMLGANLFWEKEKGFPLRIATDVSAGCLLIAFLVCRLLLIRVTGCLPLTVKAHMVRVENGPAAGVLVTEEPGKYWNEAYGELKDAIPSDANVLYIGAEQLFYPAFCEKVNTPSVQGTTVFNEMYDAYYEEFPEKTPAVIVVDETFSEVVGYYNPPENEHIFKWMDEHLEITEERTVGRYRILYAAK